MHIQCKDCRFWNTVKRQGHFAPCMKHDLPFGQECGDHESWESDYINPWMPDLGGCLGFEPRVASEHWLYFSPIKTMLPRNIDAIKEVRVHGGFSLVDAKHWFEMAVATGRKSIALSLTLKDFDGFRRAMARAGFEVKPAPAPVVKRRKKHK